MASRPPAIVSSQTDELARPAERDEGPIPLRVPSLKRSRADAAPPDTAGPLPHIGLRVSPSPKSPRYSHHPRPAALMPVQLTGAAALAEEQRRRAEAAPGAALTTGTSENPSHRAVAALLSGGGTSKAPASHAPTTAMSQGMALAAKAIALPSPGLQSREEHSPTSVTSLASLGNTASTATANSAAMTSPPHLGSLAESALKEGRSQLAEAHQAFAADPTRAGEVSFGGAYHGYPDPTNPGGRDGASPTGEPGQPSLPKSPSNKKHKCPYCETEFTRHHNLKSHLLTHSQEKPYECQTCRSKFRRLHDLKRHSKLHTGERPHTCPICKRKFARGDALARHTKGLGGCAGRRGSSGLDVGLDEDYDPSHLGDASDSMDGVMYTEGMRGSGTEGLEDERRMSLPSIKAQHVHEAQGTTDSYSAHSRTPSTYPPAGPRPSLQSPGGLYPPTSGPTSGGAASPSMTTSPISGITMPAAPMSGANSILPPGGMTESPKPLSPSGQQGPQLGHDTGASMTRQRSPSLTTHFQQTHFGRRQSGRATPPGAGMSLPSPHTTTGPKLPSLSGLSHTDSRFGMHGHNAISANGPATSAMYQPPGPLSTMNPVLSDGGSSSNFFVAKSSERDMLNHIQKLEEQVKQLTEKVVLMEQREKVMAAQMQEEKMSRLEAENKQLRGQLERSGQRSS